MGQTVPIRTQFLPLQLQHIDEQATMTKVWSYQEESDVIRQVHHLQHIKLTQQPFQCKIQTIHSQFLTDQRKWKVITAFQYFPSSLRQQIISRKKQQTYRQFYTEKELCSILNLVGFFVFKYYNHLCCHSDVFSSLFLCGQEYKLCHPQLLPNRCQHPLCDKTHLKYKLIDSVIELMLLQKVVKADYRHKHRAQKLYSHAPWLVQLLNDLMDSMSDLLELCKRSEFVRLYFCIQPRGSSGKQTEAENAKESTYSGGEREVMTQAKEEHRLQPRGQAHYRSHSAQLQSQKSRANKFINLRIQNRFNLHSLENYQKELAQSIGGDHEQSILLPNYPLHESRQIGDHIRERESLEEDTPETQSFMLLEQIAQQPESKFTEHNRSVHSVVPMTILEEQNQNQNNSQESRKHLHNSSKSLIVSEDDEYRYEGDLVQGKKHGKGTIVFNNGAYYSGDWRDDQMNGFGTLYYASGSPQYIGEWKHNKFNGTGSYFNQNMEYFEGGFNYHDFDELGRKWKSCEGEFRDDMMEGQGVLTLSNGQILRANWRKNLLNGQGVFFTFQNKQVKGLWLDNKLFNCEIQNH